MTPRRRTRPTIAAVYGGGGLFGIGYSLGIAYALDEAGTELAHAPAIGTSAGSWAAAALATGVPFLEALDEIGDDVPRFPDPRPGRLLQLATRVFGADTVVPGIRVVACRLPRLDRHVFDGTDAPVAELVAASSAVPGMLAPQQVGRHRYVDGGVRSMASIDLADSADRLLVVLPLSGPMFGPAGWFIERGIGAELREWKRTHPGIRPMLVRPTAEIAALARRPDQLFDPERARRCHALALEQGAMLRAKWAARAEPDSIPA